MEEQEKKKVAVVTGGAGFIGSHLCERLVREGYRVISLDNYFTGSKDNHVPGVEYREGHTKDIARHIPEDPDIIYHLGEYSRVEQSVLEPDIVADLNTRGTEGVVAYWKEKKCKLVYAGSSTKFGDAGAARYTSPYASTKADNSETIVRVGEGEQLPYAITYFYNVYGPRERSGVYGTVIEHFKRIHLSGAPCPIVSPGTQERNFTHVDDIVEGLVVVGEKGHGDEYELGNEQAFSILEVAELFGCMSNSVIFPPRPGNRMSSGLDTSKAQMLGWGAKQSLADYVRAFTATHPAGQLREKRVLVFATTMHPITGLAEDAFLDLARALPGVTFDVVTTCFTGAARATPSPLPNVAIHRVGNGTPSDKFLLPFLGISKALTLHQKHQYLFTWALMASYAAGAALLLKRFKKTPLLITLADQSVEKLLPLQRAFFSLLLSRADQVYGSHTAQEARAAHATGKTLPRSSLGEGDAFANALRFAYADIVRQYLQEKSA